MCGGGRMGWLDGYDGGGHRSSPFASCMTTRLPLYLPRLVFFACVCGVYVCTCGSTYACPPHRGINGFHALSRRSLCREEYRPRRETGNFASRCAVFFTGGKLARRGGSGSGGDGVRAGERARSLFAVCTLACDLSRRVGNRYFAS